MTPNYPFFISDQRPDIESLHTMRRRHAMLLDAIQCGIALALLFLLGATF